MIDIALSILWVVGSSKVEFSCAILPSPADNDLLEDQCEVISVWYLDVILLNYACANRIHTGGR